MCRSGSQMDNAELKKTLRKQYTKIRDNIPLDVKRVKSRIVFEKLKELSEYKSADNILVFVSTKSEIDTTEYIEQILFQKEKNIYVPKVDVSTKTMDFYKIESFDDLAESYMGILEPVSGEKYVPNSKHKDLCLIPGLCFDESGYRLGYGGGFYDKYLCDCDITKVMIAFSEQKSTVPLNIDELDVKMNYCITDERIYCFNE